MLGELEGRVPAAAFRTVVAVFLRRLEPDPVHRERLLAECDDLLSRQLAVSRVAVLRARPSDVIAWGDLDGAREWAARETPIILKLAER